MTYPLSSRLWIVLLLLISSISIASPKTSLDVKTVPGIHFFYGKYTLSDKNLHQQGDRIAEKTAFTIATKTKTVLNGPFTYIFENVESLDPSTLTAQIGWPVEKAVAGIDGFQYKEVPPLKSISTLHEGPHSELPQAWNNLINQAVNAGHKVTGEGRTVIKLSGANGYVVAELQLGVE